MSLPLASGAAMRTAPTLKPSILDSLKTEIKELEVMKEDKKIQRLLVGALCFLPVAAINYYYLNNSDTQLSMENWECPPEARIGTLRKIGAVLLTFPLITLGAGFMEEYGMRDMFQRRLLKEYIPSKVPPRCARILKDTTGKCFRIVTSAAVFALAHLLDPTAPQGALFGRVSVGLATAILGEIPQLGYFSAVGLHATNNIVVLIPVFHKLITKC